MIDCEKALTVYPANSFFFEGCCKTCHESPIFNDFRVVAGGKSLQVCCTVRDHLLLVRSIDDSMMANQLNEKL